jgi:hypothetical protein
LNYGTIVIDWKKRMIEVGIHNADGEMIPHYVYSISLDQLKFQLPTQQNGNELCARSDGFFHRIAPRMVAKLVLIVITFFMIFLLSILVPVFCN